MAGELRILTEAIQLQGVELDTVKLNSVSRFFYHGSGLDSDELIHNFTIGGYSDHDAVWFADNEKMAEEFGKGYSRGGRDMIAVYKVQLKCRKTLALYTATWNELDMELGWYADPREYISDFMRVGFDSWMTMGSVVGVGQYNDIAVFNENVIKILAVKIFKDGKWTKYMPLDKAEEFLN